MPNWRQYVMSRFLNCHSRNRVLNQSPHSEGSSHIMETPPASYVENSIQDEGSSDIMQKPSTSNIGISLKAEISTDIMEKHATSNVEKILKAEESSDIMEMPSTSNIDISLKAEESSDVIEKSSTNNADMSLQSENLHNDLKKSCSTPATNVILTHDFNGGLCSWQPNCCNAFVVSEQTGYPEGLSPNLRGCYAVITNRNKCWQGLENKTSPTEFLQAPHTLFVLG